LVRKENGHHQTDDEGANKPVFRNKEKVLVLCSRRITFRYRHLMMDVMALLPHSKKDVKVQAKDNKSSTLNELTDLKGCSSCLLFECRKKKDLYMWLSKSPNGPSAKFLLKAGSLVFQTISCFLFISLAYNLVSTAGACILDL
jgi:ribosome biogenesis protein BRX1